MPSTTAEGRRPLNMCCTACAYLRKHTSSSCSNSPVPAMRAAYDRSWPAISSSKGPPKASGADGSC
eukprot:13612649-Alexandrium_andersonii.AAC.1